STIYRRRATGFGEWDINIAPRAERDLREYNRRDRRTFLIIVKKMRDLSNGDFSPGNYRQINGSNVEIPIYEAKVTEELRMVYQIDCTPVYNSDVQSEQQTLKIFGIYQNKQLSGGSFWDSMSHQLGKKGDRYKQRCAQRQRPLSPQSPTFIPILFSTKEEAWEGPGGIPDLPSDDVEQVTLIFRRLVALSHLDCDFLLTLYRQPLLDSILADRDDAFVLEISPKELEIIENPHSCYVLGRSGTGKTTTMLYKMLLVEASSEFSTSNTQKIRQLFVTQSHVLADKVKEHFTKLLGGYRPAAVSENVRAAKKADRALVHFEENDWRTDLPKKYSDLQDTDFPLFISFDQLSTMIENDMETTHKGSTTRLTYNNFHGEYWPHFPQSLCKGLNPSMVFSEFMGVIMGSEKTLASKSYYLDREMYLNLGERGQSTFADQRGRIYDLFEKYLDQKRHLGNTDAAERTHTILKYLQKQGIPGKKIDYLYSDESQDNLLLSNKSTVLRSLCQNPNGLFWAGDTAQTISIGSSFRFNELKAFQFRIEVCFHQRRQKKHPELGFQSVAPRQFQLTVNYRSHTGIVNCAHSVIEVITQLWPDAIDLLERERGTVDGLRPIFFTNWNSEDFQAKQFLFGDQPSGGYIELGAQQCILVRNENAKENLRRQVGDIGLIMTLYESKGLEFNDVLLYNFFEDSGVAEAQWRVVLNVMKDRNNYSTPAPVFDKMRHGGVCTELKFLYVAITRARNNIWIADCSTKGEPMRMLWTSKDQVQNCVLGTDTPRFAISSTPEDWREQGRKLFDTAHFSEAKMCYERAYMPHEAAVAQAYHLRERAREIPKNSRREIAAKKSAFQHVANAFAECAKTAGRDATRVYFRRAGECFEEAGSVTEAIAAYTEAEYFDRVAELYRVVGKFDEAVATVQNHLQDISSGIAQKVINVARLFYFKKGQIEKAGRLFARHEDALEYLDERGLNVERAALLESLNQLSDAAEIHLNEGRTSKAITLFIQDCNSDRASDCILQELWERFSFAVFPNTQDDLSNSRLLQLAAQVDTSLPSRRDEILMFQAIADGEVSKLQLLGRSFFENENPAAATLCLDHSFTNLPRIQALRADAVAQNLELFLIYVKLLHHFAFNVDPSNSAVAEKLFGYRREGEKNYYIPQGTFLHHGLGNRSSDGPITSSDLRKMFHDLLSDHLAKRVRDENQICRIARAVQGPCLTFAIFNGHCNRSNCPQEHVLASLLNSEQYNLRVRIHLQQILIYQSLHRVIDDSERRNWISRLYTTLNPPSYQLGSVHCLDLNSIPEAEEGLHVVKEWIRGWSFTLEFFPELQFLTHVVQLARLAFQFDRTHAMSYLTRSAFMRDPRKPLMYRRPPDGSYVVAEFLSALENEQEWCLSAGVIFLRHIVTKRQYIEINIFCDIMEHFCTGLVVADRQRFKPIHDVTLPLSWLAKWTYVTGGLGAARDTHLFWLFAELLSELLEPIYSGIGADRFIFESKNLANQTLGYMIKNVFLARICRCLCLLAYNFRSQQLRDFVFNSITSLRRTDPTRRFTFLCIRYVSAESWSGLARTVRFSAGGSTLDEMVQLLHPSRSNPRPVPPVRQIMYENLEDLPRLLGSSQVNDSRNQPPSYQTFPMVSTLEAETGEDAEKLDDGETDKRLRNDDVPIDLPLVSEQEAHSEEELTAARELREVILRAYRRREEHKRLTGKSSLAAGLLEFFAECQGGSAAMDGPHRLYRIYFLGPLPHLLLCLDMVHNRAQKEAKQIKKDLQTAEHEALETLDKRLTDVQRTLKKVIEIQKALKPSGGIHPRHNLIELKMYGEQAVSLLRALPFSTPPGVREHLSIASKGLLQPWKSTRRHSEPKPKLNVEEMYY
ncbi:hypothetical protein C8R43DRAFT_874648, partial [Mycena crocata]